MSDRPTTFRGRLNGRAKPIAIGGVGLTLGGAILLLQWIGWAPETKEAHAADVARIEQRIGHAEERIRRGDDERQWLMREILRRLDGRER